MKTKQLFMGALAFVIVMTSFKPMGNMLPVKEYLSVPGPVIFINTTYNLSWSSHPNNDYYKQEYLPAGEKSETFTKMFMIEALTGNLSPKDAAQSKMDELAERKKTDAVTNYQSIQNPKTGEVILDFVISSNDIVEWNVYRYTSQATGQGKSLVLFAYSKRAYGPATTAFLQKLKAGRQDDIKSMATYKVPAVKIKPN